MLLFAILAVFIAGLMVGRTPEYLAKKIEGKEVKMAMLALIATAASILVFTAVSAVIGSAEGQLLEPARERDCEFEQQRAARFREFCMPIRAGRQ